jgi:hypothetical protein
MRSIRNALYSLVFFGLLTSVSGASPSVGTWKLNLAKSKFPPPHPLEETAVVAEQGADLSVTLTGTQADGKPFSVKYTYPKKGGPVVYSEGGPPNDISSVSKRIDDRTWEVTETRDGKVVQTSRNVVSADGKTTTLTQKGTNRQGQPVERVVVYERQ